MKRNFVRRFVPSFDEIVKPLEGMIKNDVEFRWGPRENASLDNIKEGVAQYPTLLIPDFS
jgi:hypothetical protein